MFCIKCGKENSDDAVFCQKCGTKFETDEETRVAAKAGGDAVRIEIEESDIFSISPTQKFVKIGYVLAAIGALLLVAFLSIFLPAIPWWVLVPLGLAIFLIPAFYHFRNKMIRYTLTDSKIEIDEGFIFQNSRSVPLRSIQDVSVSSTISQRMLGFGNLVIDNASEDGGKIILKNIDTPKKYADILLREMRLLDK
ncbi:MAG: PH domain-containing protein [Acidobacteria bacterium]|nr:PH domain-containing protein [Acidobacteriota bacterium]MBK8813463.1 PH domain-containing protein [Acidobacteriota bacterium]